MLTQVFDILTIVLGVVILGSHIYLFFVEKNKEMISTMVRTHLMLGEGYLLGIIIGRLRTGVKMETYSEFETLLMIICVVSVALMILFSVLIYFKIYKLNKSAEKTEIKENKSEQEFKDTMSKIENIPTIVTEDVTKNDDIDLS